jgi:hypothetical protein
MNIQFIRFDNDLSLSKDPQSIIADAKEIPPHNVEEAKCLLAIVRAEREVRRAEAQLADRLITKGHVWSEYRRLKAVEAWKKLGDAEMTVGQLRSVLSKSGFSCSELTLAVRRSKARSRHQQRGAPYSFTLFILISHLFV